MVRAYECLWHRRGTITLQIYEFKREGVVTPLQKPGASPLPLV